jgi:IMP cyclohydrolase
MCRRSDCVIAERNFISLQENLYPGRGLVAGVDESGKFLVQVYWIMGRGTDSRNRVFSAEGGRLFTEAANPAQMKDPSHIIYNAMREKTCRDGTPPAFYIVSNGDQTDTVFDEFSALICPHYTCLSAALSRRVYEPDAPNYTSRITAITHLGMTNWHTDIVILRKSIWHTSCDRAQYQFSSIANGFGFCVTTYSGDGNPLPTFTGDPLLMPIKGDISQVLANYWSALNEANRVSLAVKAINIATGKSTIVIANKYAKA